MREKTEKQVAETEAAFAFAVVLLNILILAAVAALVWSLQTIITLNNSPFAAALRETALR